MILKLPKTGWFTVFHVLVKSVETKKEEISEPKETKKDTSTKAKTEAKENKPIAKKSGNQKNMVGSGASLLNKKTRGGKGEESEYVSWP